jgi:hypothetical protein
MNTSVAYQQQAQSRRQALDAICEPENDGSLSLANALPLTVVATHADIASDAQTTQLAMQTFLSTHRLSPHLTEATILLN